MKNFAVLDCVVGPSAKNFSCGIVYCEKFYFAVEETAKIFQWQKFPHTQHCLLDIFFDGRHTWWHSILNTTVQTYHDCILQTVLTSQARLGARFLTTDCHIPSTHKLWSSTPSRLQIPPSGEHSLDVRPNQDINNGLHEHICTLVSLIPLVIALI